MAATRKKTPMKNKMKLWRRMSQKTVEVVKESLPSGFVAEVIRETRHGRQLRNALNGTNHPAVPTDAIAVMLKRAGIETPKFDKALELMNNVRKQKQQESQVVDAEIIEAPQGA